MTKKKDVPAILDEDTQAGPVEPNPTEGFASDPAEGVPTPAASDTAPFSPTPTPPPETPFSPTPDRSGDGGVGTVATGVPEGEILAYNLR